MTLRLFHLSEKNLDNKILVPKIPKNYLTKNNLEDNKTKRICFSETINGALIALSKNLENKELYVHTTKINKETKIIQPNKLQIPDIEHTKEIWILNEIKLNKEFKIKVKKAKEKSLKYKLNNKTIEIFDWTWEKIN